MNGTAILAELLTTPEGKTLEFKHDLSSLRPILKSLVAFANTAGGTLVIGRADDGAIACCASLACLRNGGPATAASPRIAGLAAIRRRSGKSAVRPCGSCSGPIRK